MNEDALSIPPFEIELNGAIVSINPLRLISRQDIRADGLHGPQFFESRHDRLRSRLSSSLVLLAQYHETEARHKRSVIVERLDETLFAILSAPAAALDLKDLVTSDLNGDQGGALSSCTDVRSENWWHSYTYSHDEQASLSGHHVLTLDLGTQPINEQPIPAIATTHSLESLILELQTNYFETLYLSRTSLVFFAKTTLSKSRQRSLEFEFSPQDYGAHILATVIPNLSNLDEKYKQILPNLVANQAFESTYQLSQIEIDTVQDFLSACQLDGKPSTTSRICSEILPAIKAREYQLLILLLLEVLSIESRSEESISFQEMITPANTQTPAILVDILVDRLAISQSLDLFSNQDYLQIFCLEVLNPYYAAKLPEIVSGIHHKCVPQDYMSFDVPQTPAKPLKKQIKSRSERSSNSATLKRTRSAPANLLSAKRALPQRKALGREVSMTKRAPSFEIQQVKAAYTKSTLTFEERRKMKNDIEEQERVQVGQTPAKNRIYDMANQPKSQTSAAPQITIAKSSKASFMGIGETPVKAYGNHGNITETPMDKTPVRTHSRVFQAPVDGVQDTPTGRSILFKLDSPTMPSSRFPLDSISPHNEPPTLRKSVTFGGFKNDSEKPPFSGNNLFDEFMNTKSDKEQIPALFGTEILAKRNSKQGLVRDSEDREGEEVMAAEGRTLEMELDWL